MMSETRAAESQALRDLAQNLQKRGLAVHGNPSPDLLPKFLGDYRPDAIALRPGGGGVIIEIKRPRTHASEERLADVAKRVAAHAGWEFRVIYLNPMAETPSEFAAPTWQQITQRLDEVKALLHARHPVPAFVLEWAILEALARLVLGNRDRQGPGLFSPLQSVQTLAEEGYLEHDAAQRLRGLAKLRNAVVHGDFSAEVSMEQVELLLQHLRAIVAEVRSVQQGAQA